MLLFPKLWQFLAVIVIGFFLDLKLEFVLLQLCFKQSLNGKQKDDLLQAICGKQVDEDLQEVF